MEEREVEGLRQRREWRGGPDAGERPLVEDRTSGGGGDVVIGQGAAGIDCETDHRVSLQLFGEGLRRVGPEALDFSADLEEIGLVRAAGVLQGDRILAVIACCSRTGSLRRRPAAGRSRLWFDFRRRLQLDVHHLLGSRTARPVDAGRQGDDQRMARKRGQNKKDEEPLRHHRVRKPPAFRRMMTEFAEKVTENRGQLLIFPEK